MISAGKALQRRRCPGSQAAQPADTPRVPGFLPCEYPDAGLSPAADALERLTVLQAIDSMAGAIAGRPTERPRPAMAGSTQLGIPEFPPPNQDHLKFSRVR